MKPYASTERFYDNMTNFLPTDKVSRFDGTHFSNENFPLNNRNRSKSTS
jgi:hypothetical protein